MIIAFSAMYLAKKHLDGIGNFTYHVFNELATKNPHVQFIAIGDRNPNVDLQLAKNIKWQKTILPIVTARLIPFWIHNILPYYIKKCNADIFISPDGFFPKKVNCKSINTIHDLNYLHNPNWTNQKLRSFVLKNLLHSTKIANRIATVSEYSKNDIINQYKVAANNIDVLYNGVSAKFAPIPESDKIKLRNKYSAGSPYFLFIGTLHPRKNIGNLIKAFDQYKINNSNAVKLIFAGMNYWWSAEDETILKNCKFKNDILFIGRVSDEQLPPLIASAMALTYIPFYEGFGIPIIEAFACGTPVITSNVTSLPEVAADAALLVNPSNTKEIEQAMVDVSTNISLRNSLIEKGFERAATFTWQKTADRLWQCILKL